VVDVSHWGGVEDVGEKAGHIVLSLFTIAF